MSPAVHGGGPRWKFFEYNTLLSVGPFREERIMDANRYFTAMHNAMSSRLPGAQLLAAVRLQDLCGNDAYLEVRRMPGEHCATVCYSTMGRRGPAGRCPHRPHGAGAGNAGGHRLRSAFAP